MVTPELSVVVPVYGCRGCLDALQRRLHETLDEVVPSWEVILIDDASPDGSWAHMREMARTDEHVHAIRLSRNFGQHAAITAGLEEARGRWVAVMDCDMQDPPEEIPRLLNKAREGYDVVLTRRDQRRQAWHRRVGARTYLHMRNFLLDTKVDTGYSTLSIVSRSVVEAFLSLGDQHRHYLLMLHWLGFDRAVVDLKHAEREVGSSSYTFRSLVKVAADGMFFQTTVLLRWSMYLGLVFALSGVLLAGVFIARYFVNQPLPGFTSLAVLILVVGGAIMVSTGVMGLYVARIFEQVKGRPLYVVAERVGTDHDDIVDPVTTSAARGI